MNKLENGDITLDVQNHEYKLKTNSDISFTSVTTFINSFFEPFDDIKISNHLVQLQHAAITLVENRQKHGANNKKHIDQVSLITWHLFSCAFFFLQNLHLSLFD